MIHISVVFSSQGYSIDGIKVTMLQNMVRSGVDPVCPRHGRINPKTKQFVFAASSLSTQYYGV